MAPHTGPPVHRTRFVGRDTERARLAALAAEHRLVSVVGPGGAGKTRLVVEWALQREPAPEWIDVAVCSRPEDLVATVLDSLGERALAGGDGIELIARRLGDSVLVLDNCEHLVEAVAGFADEVLLRSPAASIVATSREPLGLGGEAVLRLSSLGPGAAALFADRAVLAGWSGPVEGDADLVERICVRLDRLPLGIELAAALTARMSLGDIAAGLDHRYDLLAGGSRTATLRHRSMRACVEWSTQLLGPRDRAVLDRLSVFPGNWTLPQACEVVSGDGLGHGEVAAAVESLVRRSLIYSSPHDGTFRLFETVRDHAADTLQRAGGHAHWRDRHLHHVALRCSRAAADLEGPDADATVGALQAAQVDVSAALEWAIESGQHAVAAEIVADLALYWPASGRLQEAERVCAAVGRQPSSELPARWWWAAAYVAVYSGRPTEAVRLAEQAAQSADIDSGARARVLDVAGFARIYLDPAQASGMLREALVLAEAADDQWCIADTAQIVAFAALGSGALSEAARMLARARPIASTRALAQLLAWDLAGQGVIDLRRGRPISARSTFTQALQQAERTGDPNITGSIHAWSALARAASGEATDLLDPLIARLDHALVSGAGQGANELAHAALDVAVAAHRLEAAEAVWERLGEPVRDGAPTSFPRLARSAALGAVQRGAGEEARRRIDSGLHVAEEVGDVLSAAQCRTIRAVLGLMEGDLRAATRDCVEAARALSGAEVTTDQHDLVLVLAALALAAGDRAEAESLVAQVGLLHGEASVPSTLAGVLVAHDCLPASPSRARPGAAEPGAAIARWLRGRGPRRAERSGWESVTPTEAEVARQAARGLSNRAIAAELHMSPGTVKSHLEHLYTKLAVGNRTQLAALFNSRDRQNGIDRPPN